MKAKASRLDITILLIVVFFMAISTFVINSATSGTRYEGLHVNNLIMYVVLTIPMLAVAFVDYRLVVLKFSYALYGVGIVLLLLVHVAGVHLNGSTRWLDLGVIQFQPSELVKILTILVVAHLLHKRNGEPLRIIRDIVPIMIVIMIPVVFIMMQPDLGTSIVFVGIMIGMLWVGRIRWKHLLIGSMIPVLFVASLAGLYVVNNELFSKIVKPYQLTRIQTLIDPGANPDTSWHVLNSIRAIGTGQMFGKGFQQGTYVQNGYIPYDYADSIFVVVGEEFGFLGSALLLLLYFLFIYRMVQIAYDSSDTLGMYIVMGIASMMVLQIFENIAMHLGLMPLSGIALPFISYGGSSLLTNMLAVGLVLSVRIHHAHPHPFIGGKVLDKK